MSGQKLLEAWKVVTVEPSRLRMGLWGYDEGDIAASYSADVYREKQHLRQTFVHSHAPHVAMNVSGNFTNIEAKAYPVVHASYAGEIMDDYQKVGLTDHYTGKAVRRYGDDCVFGLPVIFRERPLRKKEIIDLVRRMYAYGGYFAAEAGTYFNLLKKWCEDYENPLFLKALAEELEHPDLPESQEGMRDFIQSQAVPAAAQLALF